MFDIKTRWILDIFSTSVAKSGLLKPVKILSSILDTSHMRGLQSSEKQGIHILKTHVNMRVFKNLYALFFGTLEASHMGGVKNRRQEFR